MMAGELSAGAPLTHLSAGRPDSDDVNVIVETPKGSRNKFDYDEEYRLFTLGGVLPAGAVFPFDFGFIPSTRGGDGDPLDVLVLMDEPAFTGCLVAARVIGVIEADQTEDGQTTCNDRVIAVATGSRNHRDLRSIDELNDNLLHEIEHFFVSYNAVKGKQFTPRGRFGPDRARQVVDAAGERFARELASPPRPDRPTAQAEQGARTP